MVPSTLQQTGQHISTPMVAPSFGSLSDPGVWSGLTASRFEGMDDLSFASGGYLSLQFSSEHGQV